MPKAIYIVRQDPQYKAYDEAQRDAYVLKLKAQFDAENRSYTQTDNVQRPDGNVQTEVDFE